MPCHLSADEISLVVIHVVQAFHPDVTVGPDTDLDQELGVDDLAKRRYWRPIDDILEHHGCDLRGQPDKFEGCGTVADLIAVVKRGVR